jgi:hypothetical protein
VELLRNAVAFACTPFFYVLDWFTVDDHEYDRLVAEQRERFIRQHEGE